MQIVALSSDVTRIFSRTIGDAPPDEYLILLAPEFPVPTLKRDPKTEPPIRSAAREFDRPTFTASRLHYLMAAGRARAITAASFGAPAVNWLTPAGAVSEPACGAPAGVSSAPDNSCTSAATVNSSCR